MSQTKSSNDADVQVPETAFELLSNELRRDALAFLATRESSVALADVTSAVTPSADGNKSNGESALTRDHVRNTLHHIHLPKLDDAGVVDYDPVAKTVTPIAVDRLVPYLEDGN